MIDVIEIGYGNGGRDERGSGFRDDRDRKQSSRRRDDDRDYHNRWKRDDRRDR